MTYSRSNRAGQAPRTDAWVATLWLIVLGLAVVSTGCGGGTHRGGARTTGAKPTRTTAPLLHGRTIRLHWRDEQALNTGGRLVYRASRITLAGDQYAVSVSVTNRADYSVGISTFDPGGRPEYMVLPESFGIAYREAPNPNIATRHLMNMRAAAFYPPLPKSLEPGQTWRGTFTGRTLQLRHHHEWWVIYGDFAPGGYWVSDRTFST